MKSKAIKTLRQSLGLTRNQFADSLKVAYATVYGWEETGSVPRKKLQARLAKLAGTTDATKYVTAQVTQTHIPTSTTEEPMRKTVLDAVISSWKQMNPTETTFVKTLIN